MKRMTKALPAILVLAGALIPTQFLGGCVMGNDTRVISPTVGEQLIDLKKALDEGAMTEEEYARARAELLATIPKKS